MSNPSDVFTKNNFIDWWLNKIPQDPISQTSYMYHLTLIVCLGLFGYSLATWYEVFTIFTWTGLFRGFFMSAVSMLSLLGFKQTRQAYLLTKSMYSKKQTISDEKLESVSEMMEEFNEPKN